MPGAHGPGRIGRLGRSARTAGSDDPGPAARFSRQAPGGPGIGVARRESARIRRADARARRTAFRSRPGALGEGDRSDELHRLPRLHHGLQVGERGAARRHADLRQVRRRRDLSRARGATSRSRAATSAPTLPASTVCPTRGDARRVRTASSTSTSRCCIGCKACIAACPYDAIFINPQDHAAEKCNFCAHRIDVGLEPACVVVCPTQAILIGDLNDPASRVAQIVHRDPVAVRRPEKDTRPKLFYRHGTQATLDPLAARRPDGGTFLWSEQRTGGQSVVGGHPAEPNRQGSNSSAAAMLAYDIPHKAPWDWRVQPLHGDQGDLRRRLSRPAPPAPRRPARGDEPAVDLGRARSSASPSSPITGGLLISDLTQPAALLHDLHPAAVEKLAGPGRVPDRRLRRRADAALARGRRRKAGSSLLPLAALAAPLALGAAVYTAFLFAQAKARDLWQSALLLPHMAAQAVLAGAGMTLFAGTRGGAASGTFPSLDASSVRVAVHLLFLAGEIALPHATAHARAGGLGDDEGEIQELLRGRGSAARLARSSLPGSPPASPAVVATAAVAALAGLLRARARLRPGRPVGTARMRSPR